MKKKIIIIISIVMVIVSALLILLMMNIEPISLKQSVFTYNLNDVIPTEVSDYANGSKKALSEATLDLANVNSSEVSCYDCEIIYRKKSYPFVIQIKDNNPPLAELVKVKWEIKVGDTLIASDMIQNIEETSNYTVYFDGIEPSLARTFDTPGTYNDVYIYVEDEYGNKSSRLRVSVSVGSDQIAPVLNGVYDQVIALNSEFDPLAGVSASDNLDGDITDRITVEGGVNAAVEDTYTLNYTVSDAAGNVTKVVRNIYVTSKSFKQDLVPDVRNGLYITRTQSDTRLNYFTTIRKSKLTGSTNTEIVDQMIDYLLESTVYINKDDTAYSTSYSVIVDKVGNQIGYASAFKYMCDQLGISCYYVEGETGSTAKAWNIIMYDGSYYHIDLTSLFKNGENRYYSDSEFKQLGYVWDGTYPACN